MTIGCSATWEDHSIENVWLQVTVLANENTGLDEPDVFYFGNAIAETGDSESNAVVTATDEALIRNNRTGLANRATIDSRYDLNRDGLVNVADRIIARSYRLGQDDSLQLITSPAVGSLTSKAVEALVDDVSMNFLHCNK